MICLRDNARDILFPDLVGFLVVVHVQVAVDDLPDLRIAGEELSLADSPHTVPTILWRVLLGGGCEEIVIPRADESPVRPRILILEFFETPTCLPSVK